MVGHRRSQFLGVALALAVTGLFFSWRSARHFEQEAGTYERILTGHRQLFSVIGRELPRGIVLSDELGDSVALDSVFRDGLVVAWFFSAKDCLVCLSEIEELKRLVGRSPEVAVVPVAVGPPSDDLKEFLQEMVPFRTLLDPAFALQSGVGLGNATPATLLFAQGKITIVRRGSDTGVPFGRQVGQILDGIRHWGEADDSEMGRQERSSSYQGGSGWEGM